MSVSVAAALVDASYLLVEARVRTPDGSPVAGAVVVTTLGGQGVTGADGHARFAAPRPIGSSEPIRVTAMATIEGATHTGSRPVDVFHDGEMLGTDNDCVGEGVLVDAGEIVVQAGAQCEPAWLPTFGGHIHGWINALAVFDDGSGDGPALYAGGLFVRAEAVVVNNIAKWNGQLWTALDTGVSGGEVHALAVFDEGNGTGSSLFVGGSFTSASGIDAPYIARWDGATWSAVGGGVSSAVLALQVFDDGKGDGSALYAGGAFVNAGGAEVNKIAKWDGSAWSPLGLGVSGGTNPAVVAMTAIEDDVLGGPALFVGGTFLEAGGQPTTRIARWDGASWSPLGAGISGGTGVIIHTMTVYNDQTTVGGPRLYVGGFFTMAGGMPASGFASWDGGSWIQLGLGISGSIGALCVVDINDGNGPSLIAGGYNIYISDSDSFVSVARWTGDDWAALGDGVKIEARDMVVLNSGNDNAPTLYVGGSFDPGIPGLRARSIARWDGHQWSALSDGIDSIVESTYVIDDFGDEGPMLYVGGRFVTIGNLAVNGIAKWDGQSWSALGSGVAGGTLPTVLAMTLFDDGSGDGPALYVGGRFLTAGGKPANNIAKWDGKSWSALGPGVDSSVNCLAVFDDGSGAGPALYVGGHFRRSGELLVNRIARWDGVSWSTLDSGVNSTVYAITPYNDGSTQWLIAGGAFTSASGVGANYIARWNGASWQPIGSGMNLSVWALGVYRNPITCTNTLIAGGQFTTAGGTPANRIARWSGGSFWSPLGSGIGHNNILNRVMSIAVHKDISGINDILYVGGQFTTAGGETTNGVASWDGASWSPHWPSVTTQAQITAIAVADIDHTSGAELYVGGAFEGSPAGDWFLARRRICPHEPCPGDINRDGVVDFEDFVFVLSNYGLADVCEGDLNGDGVIDFIEFSAVLNNYGAVCP